MRFEIPNEKESERIALEAELAQVREQLAALKEKMSEPVRFQLEQLELTRPKAPKQPGWESPGIRKALRNMRGTEAIENWYRYSKESFYHELLTETIMQGVWDEVRKSDKFDSGFKEDMRVMKRQYVMNSGDLTFGFDPNVTKKVHETHGVEIDKLRKDANTRLRELGPDGYFIQYDHDWTDGEGKPHRSIGSRYQQLIAEHNKGVSPEERVTDAADNEERKNVYYEAGFTMYREVSQNLADNEFTKMPGNLRDLYVVMRNMNENQLQHYRDRDLDVKIPMVEFFIEQFRDEVLGVRRATKSNLELFTWFVNKAGQSFIPFRDIRSDLTDWWEIIKSLLGRSKDSRVQPSIYPYLQEAESGGNNSKVMQRINELRKRKNPNLRAWTMDDTPFARIGVTVGYAREAAEPGKRKKKKNKSEPEEDESET